MTVEVEAREATLPALLESIQRGDEVQLLDNGQPIATVVPRRTAEMIAQAKAALRRADERSKRLGLKFDFDEFKADKEFGRR